MSRATLLPALVRALGRRELALDAWGARATSGRAAWRLGDDRTARTSMQAVGRYVATVHRDVATGRGSATLELDAGPGAPLVEAVTDAAERALATIGPAWRSPSPAAPARVAVDDPAISVDDPGRALDRVEAAVRAAVAATGATLTDFALEAVAQQVELATSGGLDATWPETTIAARLTLTVGDRALRLERRARRQGDLDLAGAIDRAVTSARRAAAASPTPTGVATIVLDADALLHDGLGLLAAIALQADPARDRQGLLAARVGQPIAVGAQTAAEPLTVTSDGTLPWGLDSTPVAGTGDPVRRFVLVERGLVRDLGLDGREAALRGVQANGGVRGLVIPAGTVDADALSSGPGPVLVIERLQWLELEPLTDRFRARIGLARLIARTGSRDVRGGLLHGRALTLALGRRSREVVATPRYRGPARWTLGPLTITGE